MSMISEAAERLRAAKGVFAETLVASAYYPMVAACRELEALLGDEVALRQATTIEISHAKRILSDSKALSRAWDTWEWG